jgi:uncharacterized repeat protein (TIGR03803 family)
MRSQKRSIRIFCDWKSLVAIFLLWAAAAIPSSTQTLTTLASFDGTNGNGVYLANLVQGTDGNFYGVTYHGGPNNGNGCSNLGCGTVFKITPTGTLTTLYNFCAMTNCADGAIPVAGLIQGANGSFYGTTTLGGTSTACGTYGCGTIFEITPTGTLTVLHSFAFTDGLYPSAALILGKDGNFYSTTAEGGANSVGTIYKISQKGTLTTLHSFNGTDGELTNSPLVQATNGNFYGTAVEGGTSGYGTVFEMTPSGIFTVLHNFALTDGALPYAGLVQASNGNLYGTTYLFGSGNYGTVFEITPTGTLTTLVNFDFTNGGEPLAGLVQASDGNLYGTTSAGAGLIGAGGIYQLSLAGTYTQVYNFCLLSQCMDGSIPQAGVIQGTNGDLYGTTSMGGSGTGGGMGTVFSFANNLKPFVVLSPTSGKVGTSVIILGNNLTGSTKVSFNGTSATFKVVSSTEIKTTVPTGAKTGFVSVTTPSGTLKSNVAFRVTP